MRHELPISRFESIRRLFVGSHLALLVDAVGLGNSPARTWVDDPDDPRAALLWDNASCYYLVGDASNPGIQPVHRRIRGRTDRPGLLTLQDPLHLTCLGKRSSNSVRNRLTGEEEPRAVRFEAYPKLRVES